jgi:3-oxoacyl-[acyl-carrier protein] reductase
VSITIDLSGRTAWVTGGAAGIGRAIVATLGQAGARVVSLDRAYEPHGPTYGGALVQVPMDVRSSEAIGRVVEALLAHELGPDILVNNAGVTRDAVVWKLTDEAWLDVLDVNLGGAFRLVRAAAPEMRRRRGGAIVNIASINGLRGKIGQSNYAASKGGLIALTKTLARELARDSIRVNAVAPGFTDSPMTRALPSETVAKAEAEILLGRAARPEDIADAVLYLASPLAGHVTGQVLVVDGGQHL